MHKVDIKRRKERQGTPHETVEYRHKQLYVSAMDGCGKDRRMWKNHAEAYILQWIFIKVPMRQRTRLHADWIGSWRFFQRSNKKETHCHQFHIGWQVALRAMSELSPLLLKAGLLFVPLRRLGQDHIENLFCCIRGRNGFNDRPEYCAFRPAIRACALSSMLKPVNDSNNCETDGDSLLVSILEKATSDCRAGRARHAAATATALARSIIGDGVNLDDEGTRSDDEDEEILGDSKASQCQVIDRVGGYIISRLGRQGKLRCSDCRTSLVSTSQSILVQERQRPGAMLLSSSGVSLTDFLRHCESHFRQVTKQLHVDNIGQRLRESIEINAPELKCCHPVDAAAAIVPLFLRVRLHHLCKIKTMDVSFVRKQNRQQNKLKKLNVL